MSKVFYVFFEDDDVDGFKVMQALKKIKGYHHVQDVTKTVQESPAIRCPSCGAIGGHYLSCITYRAMQK